jgi:hypothetical protein
VPVNALPTPSTHPCREQMPPDCKHAEGSTDQAGISERIHQSKDACDFALARHDITNERTTISAATLQRSP